jgi:hypothetical protein
MGERITSLSCVSILTLLGSSAQALPPISCTSWHIGVSAGLTYKQTGRSLTDHRDVPEDRQAYIGRRSQYPDVRRIIPDQEIAVRYIPLTIAQASASVKT